MKSVSRGAPISHRGLPSKDEPTDPRIRMLLEVSSQVLPAAMMRIQARDDGAA
jgi:hypothetical protein